MKEHSVIKEKLDNGFDEYDWYMLVGDKKIHIKTSPEKYDCFEFETFNLKLDNDHYYSVLRSTFDFFIAFGMEQTDYDLELEVTDYCDSLISVQAKFSYGGSSIIFHDILFDVNKQLLIENSVSTNPEMVI